MTTKIELVSKRHFQIPLSFYTTEVQELVSIYTGIKVEDNNVHDYVRLGKLKHQKHQLSWPDGFYDAIKKEVTIMTSAKRALNREMFLF